MFTQVMMVLEGGGAAGERTLQEKRKLARK
jgi:hypothetical protein